MLVLHRKAKLSPDYKIAKQMGIGCPCCWCSSPLETTALLSPSVITISPGRTAGYSSIFSWYRRSRDWRTYSFATDSDTDSSSLNSSCIAGRLRSVSAATLLLKFLTWLSAWCHKHHLSDTKILRIPGQLAATPINFTISNLGKVAQAHVPTNIGQQL